MTAGEAVKSGGLVKNITEFAELTGENPRNLWNWYKTRPRRFALLLKAVEAEKFTERLARIDEHIAQKSLAKR